MRGRSVVVLVGVLALAGGWSWWRFGREAPAPTWRTTAVERQDVRQVVSATGRIEAVQTVEVGAQVSGIVASLGADFNDRVVAGQVLARIDPALLEADVASAEARLAEERAAEARLAVALQRLEGVPASATTTDEVDAARAELAMAAAQVRAAEVALARARRNLGYATIRSPIDGTVVSRDVDVGQTVNAGFSAPKLFLLAGDLAAMHILAAVDESDIGRIREGQPATFTVQSYPEASFAGTVKQVRLQSATVESVVTYTVVVEVDNTDGRLLPGMTATVEFEVARADATLCVASAALRYRPDETVRVLDAGAAASGAGGDGAAASAAGSGAAPSAAGSGTGASATGSGAPSAGAERGGRRGKRGRGAPSDEGTLYLAAGDALRPLPVKIGLRGAACVEVSGDGVAEGLEVVTGVERAEGEGGAASPFGAPSSPNRSRPGGF